MNTRDYKIALIGTGILGKSICKKLLADKYRLGVWNRTNKKCKELIDEGAIKIDSIEKIPDNFKVIITVLKDGKCTKKTINLIPNIEDKLIIQMGTVGALESKNIEKLIKNKGGYYLEAPVLGSVHEALNGKLIIMIGGEQKIFNKYKFIFESLSENFLYFGSVSDAASSKLSLNFLIASLTYSFSIVLRYLEGKNINIENYMSLLRESSVYAKIFDKKIDRMINNKHGDANFNLSNLTKDLDLFTSEVKELNIDSSILEKLNLFLSSHKNFDIGNFDYSSLHLLTEKIKSS